jgi:predicted nucleic acid-binding Zn ribbon protein
MSSNGYPPKPRTRAFLAFHEKHARACGKPFFWSSGRQTVCSKPCQHLALLERKRQWRAARRQSLTQEQT